MTVIAVKDGVMAADSGERCGELMTTAKFPKITRTPDGSLVGCAGYAADCWSAQQWFLAGGSVTNPLDTGLPLIAESGDGGLDILVLRPDGSVWRNTRGVRSFYPEGSVAAIGGNTASIVAETAMRLGRSAGEAVKVCIEMCASIYGPVQIERLDAPQAVLIGPLNCEQIAPEVSPDFVALA